MLNKLRWYKHLNEVPHNKLSKEEKRNYIIIAKDISHGPKMFSCMHIDKLCNLMKNVSDKHKRYNEINYDSVKFNLDLEGYIETNTHLADIENIIKYVKNVILKKATELIKISHNIDVDINEFIYLNSSDNKKFSFHIITSNRDFVFKDKANLKNFVADLINAVKEWNDQYLTVKDTQKEKCIIDLDAAGGQSLRIYYCRKFEGTRVLLHYDEKKNKTIKEYDEEILKKTLLGFNNKEDNLIHYTRKSRRLYYTEKDKSPVSHSNEKSDRYISSSCHTSIDDKELIDYLKELAEEGLKKLDLNNNLKLSASSKINEERDTIKFYVKSECPCPIKEYYGKQNGIATQHKTPSGYYIVVSLRYFTLQYFCHHPSCKSLFEWNVKNMTIKLDANFVQTLRLKVGYDYKTIKRKRNEEEEIQVKKTFNIEILDLNDIKFLKENEDDIDRIEKEREIKKSIKKPDHINNSFMKKPVEGKNNNFLKKPVEIKNNNFMKKPVEENKKEETIEVEEYSDEEEYVFQVKEGHQDEVISIGDVESDDEIILDTEELLINGNNRMDVEDKREEEIENKTELIKFDEYESEEEFENKIELSKQEDKYSSESEEEFIIEKLTSQKTELINFDEEDD